MSSIFIPRIEESPGGRPSVASTSSTSKVSSSVWGQISESEGVSRAELAYRWIVYHSKLRAELGDAVIVGARKQQQLRNTMAAIKKGPLSDGAVEGIEAIWATVKDDAALDSMEIATTIADKLQQGSG
ncbi:aldehyde reductase (GliO) [Apiospora sp. TS-2023a]